ncbi:alpha/beta hydrolase [Kitasatospora mediocidica]|uniref:alpha/beta hydrolase n=1 Tax=Kitasatospora mediocidica TaxID=58352 RepID=UPI00056BDE44|nr:alpha/beta hydrolase-fold protein [Kitasatospora mediocidica]
MNLTSSGLVYALVALAVLTVLATLWFWPRLAPQRLLPMLGRICLLTVTQLTVLAVCALAVNHTYGFYSSWDDLLHPGDAPLALAPPVGGTGKSSPPKTDALVQPTTEGGLEADDVPQGTPEQVGRVDSVLVHGKESGLSDQMFIYLPPEYFNPKYARHRFPVLLSLAGFPGTPLHLLKEMDEPKTIWDLQRTGKMEPTIVVMARPSVAAPRDTECVNVPGGPQTETWFAKDVPTALRSAYRVSRSAGSWGVLGYSTGGGCALRLAARFPDTYSAAAGLHADYTVVPDPFGSSGDLYSGNPGLAQQYDLAWRLQNMPAPKVSMLVVSTRTEDNYPATQQFLSVAQPVAAAHPEFSVESLFLPDGGHSFDTWRRELPAALEWMSDRLAPPPDREPRS